MSDQSTDEQFLLGYLWHHRVPCPRCRIELHGLASASCPHCGEKLRIGVGMAQPHLRGWLALVIPLIGSAGIGLLFLVLMAKRGTRVGSRYPYMLLTLIYFWSAIPLAAMALVGRRKVMRWNGTLQRIMAAAAWIVSIVALLLMFLREF